MSKYFKSRAQYLRAFRAAKLLRGFCQHIRKTKKYSQGYDAHCPQDCPYNEFDPLDIWGPEPPPCYLKETWKQLQVGMTGPCDQNKLAQLWEK